MHCVLWLTYDVLSGNLGIALRSPVPKCKELWKLQWYRTLSFGEHHCSERQWLRKLVLTELHPKAGGAGASLPSLELNYNYKIWRTAMAVDASVADVIVHRFRKDKLDNQSLNFISECSKLGQLCWKTGVAEKVSGEENNLFKRTPCHLILPWKTKLSFR